MLLHEQVRDYLRQVRRRLRLAAVARGLAISGVAAFALTVIAVLLANAWKFSEVAIYVFGGLLWAATGLALALWVVRPLLRRLSDARIARFVEDKHPQLHEGLVTAVELGERSSVDETSRLFRALVAQDALAKSAAVPPPVLIERQRIVRPLLWAGGGVALILLLGFFGPGVFRYGTRVLWTGWVFAKADPLYQIQVTPGNLTVGSNSDQEILARPVGFLPQGVRLFALYPGNPNWEAAPMLPEERGGGFRFLLMNIQQPIEYYAEANGVRSRQYRISVIEVPRAERLEIRYQYPAYSGMKDVVETHGGDIIALQGTKVTLVVHSDTATPGGRLVMDDGTELPLESLGDRQLQASWTISKDSLYHVRLKDHRGREARASDEYLIEALPDNPPTLRLARPGRDMQPSPIEEVLTAFEGQDDVRLAEVRMSYSVNGGAEKSVPLAQKGAGTELSGSHTLFLEEFELVPGDLISFYGVAKDAKGNTTESDMFFLQVRPFERSYTQGQAGGGGGGGGGQENTFLSEQQKQIITATWNVIRKKEQHRPEQLAEAAEVLSSVQRSLQQQAETLAGRVDRRELGGVNEEFGGLVENMRKAAEAMSPAAELLEEQKFPESLTPEQTALQYLLRAEALFRDIQVAFGNSGGGGGAAGNSGRDLADLFALELDTTKNQYETLSQFSGGGERNAEMNEAIRKLQELARRQEELARQERDSRSESLRAASRWEQEMLRREAEELARQLEQLSRSMNSSQISSAARSLSQAARDMQQAGNQQGSSGSSERERALQRLREANDMLAGQKNSWDEEALRRLTEDAEQLARQQQKIAEDVRRMAATRGQDTGPVRSGREALNQTLQDKLRLLESLRNLERQLNQAASRMADDQKKTTQKLRGASSMIQDERMADKIRQGAWLAQQGMWPTAAPVEEDLKANLEQLRDQMKDAQRSLQAGGADDKLRQALSAAERVRQGLESLERQRAGSQDRQGQPGEPGQEGQQGQRGEQGQGGQEGSQGAQGQQGGGAEQGRLARGNPSESRRGGAAGTFGGQYRGDDARNAGGYQPNAPSPLTPEEQRQLDEQYRQLVQEAGGLRELLSEDPEFGRLVRDLVTSMQNLDWQRFSGNPELRERMSADLIDQWRELELRLGRQLGDPEADTVRLAGEERVPEKYRSILEEYFRALSRSKR